MRPSRMARAGPGKLGLTRLRESQAFAERRRSRRKTDAQRLQEGKIAGVKGPSVSSVTFCGFLGFCLDLVQADGGLKHEEDVETLFADVFDNACDVLRLGDGLVDRLAEFLDKVFDLLIQCHLRAALWFESHRASGIPG